MEIRMEIANEVEAREYCRIQGYGFIRCYMGYGEDQGKLMMLAEQTAIKEGIDIDYYEEPDDTRIFTITSTGKMYVADKKKCSYATTFDPLNAKLIKYSKA